MGAIRTIVTLVFVVGCLPRPEPAQPMPPPMPPQSPAPQPQPVAQPQPGAQPQPQPQPATQPQPQPDPPRQPYAPSPYASGQPQPAYYPQPYAYGYQPQPIVTGHDHLHDGEVIGDFAAVGALASIDLCVRQDITNGNAVTFVLLAGLAGGGGAGYLLTTKYPIDAGAAHSTTIGLLLGAANGALLVEPLHYSEAHSVMGVLTLGSVVGAAGGFVYGQAANLTSGQATFVGNMMVMGSATALLTAVTANRDGHYGGFENGTLALGLDGGAVIGALVAPRLDWSPHRAKLVFASSLVGALVGGMAAGLIAKPSNGDATDANVSIVTATMTAGLWGGLGVGILMTKDSPPDPIYLQPAANRSTSTPTSFVPWVGDRGQVGMMAGGTF